MQATPAFSAIEAMSPGHLLDRLDVLHETQRKAEAEILVIAVQHALIHNENVLHPDRVVTAGHERAVRFGGEGTPPVAEFADADFGARIQLTPWSARQLIGDALDLRYRLPNLWSRVQQLEIKVSYARYVARKTRQLTEQQAAFVDERVAESADGRIPWTRFEALVEGAIAASDPEAAAAREEAARREQHANPTRSTEDGMRGFHIRAPFPVIAKLDAMIAWLADALGALGHEGNDDERRVMAVLILCNPQQALDLIKAYAEHQNPSAEPLTPRQLEKLLPAVMLFLHLHPGEDNGIVRAEGHGPVTREWVKQHLGLARFRIQPVLDLEGQAPVDGYEIPDRHRQAVQLMTPADTFPFASNTSRSRQLDHTVAYRFGVGRPPGQSRMGNYGPLTTYHHRIKTHGRWQVHQPTPGVYLWTDPYGARYRVDHTGTRRIPEGPVVELHTVDDLVLDYAA